jgi:membrane-associated phospholipid phosphatase
MRLNLRSMGLPASLVLLSVLCWVTVKDGRPAWELEVFQNLRSLGATSIFRLVSSLGLQEFITTVVILIAVYMGLYQKRAKAGFWYFAIFSLMMTLTYRLKTELGLPRPNGSGQGFPSAHAVRIAFLMFTMPILWSTVGRVIAMVVILLVCLARVVLGSHFPMDVVAGAFMGAAAALVWRSVVSPDPRDEE